MRQEEATLVYKTHRGNRIIGVKIRFNKGLISLFKQHKFRWSQTNKFWYVPDTPENRKRITSMLATGQLKPKQKPPQQLIDKPEKEKKPPRVITKKQVQALLATTANLKHKSILSLIYWAGLRVSELLNLRKKDVNFKAKLIYVPGGAKGSKGKTAILDGAMVALLQQYLGVYKPNFWLFEGLGGKCNYSNSSINAMLKRMCKKANIPIITAHSLRLARME